MMNFFHTCPAAALSQGHGNVSELPKPNSQGEMLTEIVKKCFILCFVRGVKVLCLLVGIPDGFPRTQLVFPCWKI